MLKVKLFTRAGGFVHEATIPPFTPAPEILTWGDRAFVRSDASLIEQDGSRSVRYVEGLLYPLIEGATTA